MAVSVLYLFSALLRSWFLKLTKAVLNSLNGVLIFSQSLEKANTTLSS